MVAKNVSKRKKFVPLGYIVRVCKIEFSVNSSKLSCSSGNGEWSSSGQRIISINFL